MINYLTKKFGKVAGCDLNMVKYHQIQQIREEDDLADF